MTANRKDSNKFPVAEAMAMRNNRRKGDGETVSISVNLYYHGKNSSARKYAEEMEQSGIADAIRKEDGRNG